MSRIVITLRALLLASVAVFLPLSASQAGKVRETVPTQLVPAAPPPTPVVLHNWYAPSILVHMPPLFFVNCDGITASPGMLVALPGGPRTVMPAFTDPVAAPAAVTESIPRRAR